MTCGVITFPGTWSDRDCLRALAALDLPARPLWHQDTSLGGVDRVILPGGFSYGDYLRCGAIARFSPIMRAVEQFAADGGLVFGICNGFQILCEAGLLPGALLRNVHLQYRCQWAHLRVEQTDTALTRLCQPGQVLRIPIGHGEGNYFADPPTLAALEANGQVLFRYCTPDGAITPEANPNGSLNNIAGIRNAAGNVFGMMPHPERCVEAILGGTDGRRLFEALAGRDERVMNCEF